jgi:hypothetical protein
MQSMIKLADRSEQDVLLDKLLFAYRTVDEESVHEIDRSIMKSIQRTILGESAKAICTRHLEYGSVNDKYRYGLKIKNKDIRLSDVSYALVTSELHASIQSIQELVTPDEWDAILWVIHIILDALEFQPREADRLPACSDGRLRSQGEFLDKLVYLSRRGYYASIVTMHDGPKSFQFFNDDLFWSFLHLSSETTGALNVVERIMFGYEDRSLEPPLQFTRAGLMLKEKRLFILDVFEHLDSPSTYPLLNQRRLKSRITEAEWHAVFYFVLTLLKLFECEITTEYSGRSLRYNAT